MPMSTHTSTFDQDDGIDYSSVNRQRETHAAEATRYLNPVVIIVELLVLAALLIAGFALYQNYGTSLHAQRVQDGDLHDVRAAWGAGTVDDVGATHDIPDTALGIIASDVIGGDYVYHQGVDNDTLARGPGAYAASAAPGEVGNLSLAAHRDGWNAPFSEVDKYTVCDPITIETRDAVHTYKVVSSEDGNQRARENAECFGAEIATTLNNDDHADIEGVHIVKPDDVSVLDQIPGAGADVNADLGMLTLTSCHPHNSNAERIIVHAVLTDTVTKD